MVVEDKSIRRKSKPNATGGDDDDDWLTQDLADDAVWKRIQQNTFTRWANEHLKTVNKYVACLEADLSDGIRLLALVEVLSGKKLPRYNAKPTMKAQKLNNVDLALKFLQDVEKVKLVNISSSDIVEGNVKLILGLMWTLILHYSISMPVWEGEDDFDPSLTPKQRLLKWIQSRVPDVPVNNFTTDWNDGKAIGALVDSVAPGLCPDYKSWRPEDAPKNAEKALQLAEDWLDVPQLIKPKEMCNRKVDELSMMTYLSQFPSAKLKPDAPIRPGGAGQPNRVRCYGPGLQATGVCVGAETNFTIETFSAGKGDVEVKIICPDGNTSLPSKLKFNDDRNMTYTCTYTAKSEGDHSISVLFNGTEVPKSPHKVSVKGAPQGEGHKRCSAQGPGIEPRGKVRVGQQTHIDINTAGAGPGQLEVVIMDPEGKPNACPCRLRKLSDDKYKCEYVPESPGLHSISVLFAGKPIQKSPFGVDVESYVDPRRVRATGRGLQPSGLRVGDSGSFRVRVDAPKAASAGSAASKAPANLKAKLVDPDGNEFPVNVKRIEKPDGAVVFECDYKPSKTGDHRLSISIDGQEVRQFEVNVAQPSQSKVIAYGPGLHGGCVGKPNRFRVDTRGERGTLGFTIDGPGEAKIECKDNGDGTADVEWTVAAPGEYALHVMSNGEDIPNSAFCARIKPKKNFDEAKLKSWFERTYPEEHAEWIRERPPKKESASQADRPVRKIVVGLVSTMTITIADTSNLQAFIEAPSGSKTECELKAHVDDPTKLVVLFTAHETGLHLVHVQRGDKPIGGSPFKFEVVPKTAADPTKVHIDTEHLKDCKVDVENEFLLDTRGAGVGKVGVFMHGPSRPEVKVMADKDAPGLFKVQWMVTEAGKYQLELRYDGVDIPGSPFKVVVPKPTKSN